MKLIEMTCLTLALPGNVIKAFIPLIWSAMCENKRQLGL